MPAKDTAGKKQEHQPQENSGLFAFQKKVVPGATIGAFEIIKSGLKEEDVIVVDGVQALHDGSAVTTANKVPPAQPGKGGK